METIVELRNVSKTFKGKAGSIEALKSINLRVGASEVFGIIGLSGAGKSTLIRTVNLLEKPDSGHVLIQGVDLQTLSAKQLLGTRHSIGMIFQSFNLIKQKSVLDNVCFPLEISGISKTEAKKRALEVLELVGVSDKVSAYPSQLSGGQQQRVAIARAIANNPSILLCDEATSALDPETTESILSLLTTINERLGLTILVITHEMSVIEAICDRVAILSDGEIVETGWVSDVFKSPQSDMGKRLIAPRNEPQGVLGKNQIRVVFDGTHTNEPVIAAMILETGKLVNIMYANTKTLNGRMFGEMILELPEDPADQFRMCQYLDHKQVSYSRGSAHD